MVNVGFKTNSWQSSLKCLSQYLANSMWLEHSVGFLPGIMTYLTSFFLLLAAPWHVEFPGQGSVPIHSCNLCCSCGGAGSLTRCAGSGMEPVSRCCRDIAGSIASQWELLTCYLWMDDASSNVIIKMARDEKVRFYFFQVYLMDHEGLVKFNVLLLKMCSWKFTKKN